MKRFLLIPVFVIIALVFTLPAAAAPPDGFTGRWEGTDLVDGSTVILTIGGNPAGTRLIIVRDDSATVACPITDGAFQGRGTGTVSGNVLTYSGSGECVREDGSADFSGTLVYDPSTNTLTDTGFLGPGVFTRVGGP